MTRHALLGLVLAVCVPDATAVANPVAAPHVEVGLVSAVRSVRPGEPFDVGLRFVLEDEWHVYWQNPGDSGLAPSVRWTLPGDAHAGPLQWPHPERIPLGPLVNFGYEGEAVLPVRITPPADLRAGDTLRLAARADWLVCKEDCIPGEADLTLELPVAASEPVRDPRWAAAFDAARARLPRDPHPMRVAAYRSGDRLELRVAAADGGSAPARGDVVFFPADAQQIEHAAPQEVTRAGDAVLVGLERARQRSAPVERLAGTLVAESGFAPDGNPALAIDVAVEEAPGSAGPASSGAGIAASDVGAPASSLRVVVAFAALGGLLLNFMPCVFPVLSIKILDFVRQASGSRERLRAHGLVYGAGVLLSFWVLAGLLLALRAGGEVLGWGFQVQSPAFVVAMAFLLFALALSLLGLFDVGLGLTALAGRVPQGDGLAGSFATGVLATVVATPCTAPFMGPALGYALAASPSVALAVFTALGAGMAVPYVLLCFVPGWLRVLPRSGPWLETFKQAMAFPLLATVVWLLWVLGQQAGVDAILGALAGLLLLAFAVWLGARLARPGQAPRARTGLRVAVAVLSLAGVAVALLLARGVPQGEQRGSERDLYGVAWRDWSERTVAELRAAGTPVFVDFTAAWCLTCKVNEHVVFSSQEVRDAFLARGVVLLRADWTSRDDAITRALAAFGRSGVPLYVLYGPADAPPQVLPSVLTRGIVLEALAGID